MTKKRGKDMADCATGQLGGKKRYCIDCINFKCLKFDKHNHKRLLVQLAEKGYHFKSLRRLCWALQNHFEVWLYFCRYQRTQNEYYISVELGRGYVARVKVNECMMYN